MEDQEPGLLPFLRFLQSLSTGEWSLAIKPKQMHVQFEAEDGVKDRELHVSKFENVKRLIELHWLEGFPLWGCLTGFTDYEGERSPFFDWMYSVRQIVALYRIDREVWKSRSVQYLQGRELLESDEISASNFSDLTDAELVETVIDMLCQTIEYHLGYDGNYPAVGRDGKEWKKGVFKAFRYKRTHRKTAGARVHPIVHLIGQNRKRIDEDLRARLGEAYENWERLADEQKILEGVIL